MRPSPEVEDVGARQGLQPAVPLADGLAAQAAVELGLLHALVEAHDVGAQLALQPLAAVDALAQAVQLELAELRPGKGQVRTESPRRCPRGPAGQSGHTGSGPSRVLASPMGLGKTPRPLWALVCPRAE